VAVPRWEGRAQAPPNLGYPPPKKLAISLTHCGQLILRKISKSDATRCQILRLKCTEFDFRSAPDPAGELTAPQLYLRGLLLRGGRGKKGDGKRGGGERGGKGRGGEWHAPPQIFWPITAPG